MTRPASRLTVARSLKLATATTAALIAGSLALRVLNPFGAPPPDASDWVPHLWAMGALTLVALTHTWAPTVAWISLVVGSTAAALASVGLVREVRAATGIEAVPVLSALVAIALVVPPVVAAAYATSDGRRPRVMLVVAWLAAGAMSLYLVTSFAARTMGGERGGVPEWLWLAVIAALTAAGLVRDLGPAFSRTRDRLLAERAAEPPPEPGARGRATAFTSFRVLLDELVPGREAGRVQAAETERGRLAADLHAEVLPSLRRALVEVESGGTVERLAADLRTAVDEVEALLVSRRSIVLEEMGLLAAIEWLAERTEDRSDVRVEILVEGDAGPTPPGRSTLPAGETAQGGPTPPGGSTPPGGEDGHLHSPGRPDHQDPARPPRDVERAAFRVAQLAMDNVVRHAAGASATVRLLVTPDAVRLRIVDDGAGPPVDEVAAARGGRRGVADMRAEAKACGAAVEIGRGPNDRGTSVGFAWPA